MNGHLRRYSVAIFLSILMLLTMGTATADVTLPESLITIEDQAFALDQQLTGTLVIPEGVTSIGVQAFYGCTGITHVVLPESLTSIADNAFAYCTSLVSITIPESVEHIGQFAFYQCSSLEQIDLPDSMTSIDGAAFYGCASLESLTIPEGIETISASLLYECENLAEIVIPDSVQVIEANAFYDCVNLKEVTLPSGLTELGDAVFMDCSSIENLVIPEGVTKIGSSAFWGCTNLTEIDIAETVESIGMYAFGECSSLTEIKLQSRITQIESWMFAGCRSLQSVSMHNRIFAIGEYAFYDCPSLQSIVIPESVDTIGENAFGSTTELRVYAGSAAETWAIEHTHPYSLIEEDTLPAPGNFGISYDSSTTVLDAWWDAVTGATGYCVYIVNPMNQEQFVFEAETATTLTVTLNGGIGSGDFLVYVMAQKDDVFGAMSEVMALYIAEPETVNAYIETESIHLMQGESAQLCYRIKLANEIIDTAYLLYEGNVIASTDMKDYFASGIADCFVIDSNSAPFNEAGEHLVTVEFTTTSGNTYVVGSLTITVEQTASEVEIAAPTNVQAEFSRKTGFITVEWDAVDGVEGYQVYLADPAGEDITYVVQEGTTITISLDEDAPYGQYLVYVCAVCGDQVGEMSESVFVDVSAPESAVGYLERNSLSVEMGETGEIWYSVEVTDGTIDTVFLMCEGAVLDSSSFVNDNASGMVDLFEVDSSAAPFNELGEYVVSVVVGTTNGNEYHIGDVTVKIVMSKPDSPYFTGSEITEDGSYASVWWNEVEYATKYTLYYGTSSNIAAAAKMEIFGQEYCNTTIQTAPGTTYYLWVSASNDAGESGVSAPTVIVTPEEAPPCTLELDLSKWKPDYTADVCEVLVTCDDTYSVSVSGSASNWLSYEQAGNTLYLKVTKNTSGADRAGYIYVTCDDHEEEVSLKVTQAYGEDVEIPTVAAGIQTIYVVVKWNTVSNATEGYVIQCAMDSSDNITAEYDTPNRDYEFVYDEAHTWFFRVKACGEYNDSAWSDWVSVNVEHSFEPVAEISIDKPRTLYVGSQVKMTADVLPSSASVQELFWQITSGADCATIDPESGVLTCIQEGTITVKATSRDGKGVYDTRSLTINPGEDSTQLVTSISIDQSSFSMATGETRTLTASVTPSGADNPAVKWTVRNGTGTAAINSSGVLTALTSGTVYVSASSMDGSGVTSSEVAVTIVSGATAVEQIEITDGDCQVYLGETKQLSASVLPVNATYTSVIWTVENGTGSATISSSGLLTPVSAGTVKVTASSADGANISDSVCVTILAEQGAETTKLSGMIMLENGAPMAGVSVLLSSQNDYSEQYFAVSDDNGAWEVEGLSYDTYYYVFYVQTGYSFTGSGDLVTLAGGSLECVASLDSAEDGMVSFVMEQNGQEISTAGTGVPVDFVVTAPGVTIVRLVVDGVAYNQYAVVEDQARFSRAFSQDGTRSIQIQAYIGDEWSSISVAKTLKVTAAGTLAAANIDTIPTQYVSTDMTISWSAVPNAEQYTVYLYDGYGLVWPASANHTAESTTQNTYITIPGQWLMGSGNYSVNVVATAANYTQSTAAQDFVVEEKEMIAIADPLSGTEFTKGTEILVRCTVRSGITNIRLHVAPPANGASQWLSPDETGFFRVLVDQTGTYTLTPYYALTDGSFTVATADGAGESVSIDVAMPQIKNLKQGAYQQYAYYIAGQRITFTGSTNAGCDVLCEVSAVSDVENGTVPECNPTVVVNEDGSFTCKTEQLMQSGKYIFTFTPVKGNETGTSASFTVYMMKDMTDAVKYIATETKMLNLPDGSKQTPLAAGTEVKAAAVWGDYAYVIMGKKSGFVERTVLIDQYQAVPTAIVSVQEPEIPFIAIGDTATFQVEVEGNVKELLLYTETESNTPVSATYTATLVPGETNLYTVTMSIAEAVPYRCTLVVVDYEGVEKANGQMYYVCGMDTSVEDAGKRVYAKYLAIEMKSVDGSTEVFPWEDPADYEMHHIGSYFDVGVLHNVIKITAKDGNEKYWKGIDIETYVKNICKESTEDVVCRGIIIACYMDHEKVLDEYGNVRLDSNGKPYKKLAMKGPTEDSAYTNYRNMRKIYSEIGIEDENIFYRVGPVSKVDVKNMLKLAYAKVDYNDVTYVYVAAHGGYTEFWCLTDREIMSFTDLPIEVYTSHKELKCYYIIDSCFSGNFVKYTDNQTGIFSTPVNGLGKYNEGWGCHFTRALTHYVLNSGAVNLSVVDICNEIRGLQVAIEWLGGWGVIDPSFYYDPSVEGSEIIFVRK